MFSSLLLKEWLKLRTYFFAALLLNLGVCIKIFFDIRQQIHSEPAKMVWYQVIHLHSIFFSDIRYIPLFTGLVLAAAQFIPEIQGRRMRIALHLPTGRNRMLFFCLLTGILLYLVTCLLSSALIFLTLRSYFPQEVAASTFSTMAPWLLSGLMAYLGTINVLLETHWPRRVFHLLLFTALCAVLFDGYGYSWFSPALGYVSWLAPLGLLSIFETGRRFQHRGA